MARRTLLSYDEILVFLGTLYQNHRSVLARDNESLHRIDSLLHKRQEEIRYVYEACANARYHEDREHGEPLDSYIETYFELERAGWRPSIRWPLSPRLDP
ncbi:hypothetical protein EBZ80_12535 [bacterium]|nr:hypothetical protein [bacterium]